MSDLCAVEPDGICVVDEERESGDHGAGDWHIARANTCNAWLDGVDRDTGIIEGGLCYGVVLDVCRLAHGIGCTQDMGGMGNYGSTHTPLTNWNSTIEPGSAVMISGKYMSDPLTLETSTT